MTTPEHRNVLTGTVLAALLAACSPMQTDLRQENAVNIGRIEIGMNRQDVMDIMGTGADTVSEAVYHEHKLVDYIDLSFSNPYRTEKTEVGGDRYEVLFFYAMPSGMSLGYWDTHFGEGTVPDWGLTPVILKNGVVVGLGTEALEAEGLIEAPSYPDKDESLYLGSLL